MREDATGKPTDDWDAAYLAPLRLEADPDRSLQGAAHDAAFRHMARYRFTQNGLLVWRAYMEFRQRGLAPPDWLLLKFDQWAIDLEKAAGATEVAQAIEMFTAKGGPGAAARLRKSEDGWRVANAVHVLTRQGGGGLSDWAAYEAIASQEGKQIAAVKANYLRHFPKKKKNGAESTVGAHLPTSLFGTPLVKDE